MIWVVGGKWITWIYFLKWKKNPSILSYRTEMKCVKNVLTRPISSLHPLQCNFSISKVLVGGGGIILSGTYIFYYIRSLFQNSPVHNLFRQMLNSLSLEMLCDTQLRRTLKLKTSTFPLVKILESYIFAI